MSMLLSRARILEPLNICSFRWRFSKVLSGFLRRLSLISRIKRSIYLGLRKTLERRHLFLTLMKLWSIVSKIQASLMTSSCLLKWRMDQWQMLISPSGLTPSVSSKECQNIMKSLPSRPVMNHMLMQCLMKSTLRGPTSSIGFTARIALKSMRRYSPKIWGSSIGILIAWS